MLQILKDELKRQKVTQISLANRIGISKSAMESKISEHTRFTVAERYMIACLLGADPERNGLFESDGVRFYEAR